MRLVEVEVEVDAEEEEDKDKSAAAADEVILLERAPSGGLGPKWCAAGRLCCMHWAARSLHCI